MQSQCLQSIWIRGAAPPGQASCSRQGLLLPHAVGSGGDTVFIQVPSEETLPGLGSAEPPLWADRR